MVVRGTGAVIVAFHPDLAALTALVANLAAQVERVLVVDNTPAGTAEPLVLTQAEVLSNGANLGIAEGLNRGIQRLLEQGVEYVLLSDQDSVPTPNFVAELMAAHQDLTAQGVKVGTVGALYVDVKNEEETGFAAFDGSTFSLRLTPDATGYVPTPYVISSGSLTHRSAFEAVGLMEADLFIDLVDVEWCYRALYAGYAVYGVLSARMAHNIGDHLVRYWTGKWKILSRHSPFRVYFQYRNFVLLLKRRYMPSSWKLWVVRSRLIQLYVIMFFYRDDWWATLRNSIKGMLHGVVGRSGPLSR